MTTQFLNDINETTIAHDYEPLKSTVRKVIDRYHLTIEGGLIRGSGVIRLHLDDRLAPGFWTTFVFSSPYMWGESFP